MTEYINNSINYVLDQYYLSYLRLYNFIIYKMLILIFLFFFYFYKKFHMKKNFKIVLKIKFPPNYSIY